MMIGLFFVVFFAGVVGLILLVVALSLRAAVRSAKTSDQRRPGQPHGTPGNLDWLPEPDDLQRRAQYGVRTDPGTAGSGQHHQQHHHQQHGYQQEHHGHHSSGPSFDSSSTPSHHDSGGGSHHH
ncbi:hypothetical protein [Kitasatospora sp. MAP5-34]|uniref:hypothetical protein n=1 Tax=Kitasatospora sp. MAP5-34 TaxID=3035102 RepID=UPI0024757002|nr:hypothetical protein [Kitasatospora sp. MAP5-34]MDH6575960.1 hypothetical protein [Kitasatospora sp. MAP5-34]